MTGWETCGQSNKNGEFDGSAMRRVQRLDLKWIKSHAPNNKTGRKDKGKSKWW